MKRIKAVLLIVCLIFTLTLQAKEYHVAKTGYGFNNGSRSSH